LISLGGKKGRVRGRKVTPLSWSGGKGGEGNSLLWLFGKKKKGGEVGEGVTYFAYRERLTLFPLGGEGGGEPDKKKAIRLSKKRKGPFGSVISPKKKRRGNCAGEEESNLLALKGGGKKKTRAGLCIKKGKKKKKGRRDGGKERVTSPHFGREGGTKHPTSSWLKEKKGKKRKKGFPTSQKGEKKRGKTEVESTRFRKKKRGTGKSQRSASKPHRREGRRTLRLDVRKKKRGERGKIKESFVREEGGGRGFISAGREGEKGVAAGKGNLPRASLTEKEMRANFFGKRNTRKREYRFRGKNGVEIGSS